MSEGRFGPRYVASTINGRLSVLHRLARLARDRGMIAWRLHVKCVRPAPKDRLLEERLAANLRITAEIAERSDLMGLRDAVVTRLVCEAALSPRQIVAVDVEDYWSGKGLLAVRTRTRAFVFIQLRPTTCAIIDRWLARHPLGGLPRTPLVISRSAGKYIRMPCGRVADAVLDRLGATVVRRERVTPAALRRAATRCLAVVHGAQTEA
jgi:hypothetical protein